MLSQQAPLWMYVLKIGFHDLKQVAEAQNVVVKREIKIFLKALNSRLPLWVDSFQSSMLAVQVLITRNGKSKTTIVRIIKNLGAKKIWGRADRSGRVGKNGGKSIVYDYRQLIP